MRRWPFVALFVGLVLQVAAWVLVIPPYSTYDEFDHVYRASSVWHGQATAVTDPPPGYPGAVLADRDLVEDGVPECMTLPYTGLGRCLPGPARRDGTVLVTSGAAHYNPLYYLLESPASAVGSGAGTVMWMRVWSAAITCSVLAWALALMSSWQQPRKAVLGVALAASPMLAISIAVVAPNGLEMAAGLLWWSALLTVTGKGIRPRTGTWAALLVGGSLLAMLRSLGPFFLVASLLVVTIWRGPELRRLWRTERRAVVLSAAVTGLCVGLSGFWILTQHAPTVDVAPLLPDVGLAKGLVMSLGYLPAMITLFVGAIPARNLAPSSVAVAAWLVPFVLLLVNVRWRRGRAALALCTLTVVVLVFPVVFQGILFGRLGFVWQSRYILPLAIGVPLLAALQTRTHPARDRVNDAVTVAGLLVAHLLFIRTGLHWYAQHSPLVSAGRFPLIPEAFATVLSAVGVAAIGTALWLAGRPPVPARSEPGRHPSSTAPLADEPLVSRR